MERKTYAMFRAGDTRTNEGEILLVLQDDSHDCRKLEKSLSYGGYSYVGHIFSYLDEVQIRSGIGYKAEQDAHQAHELLARYQALGLGIDG